MSKETDKKQMDEIRDLFLMVSILLSEKECKNILKYGCSNPVGDKNEKIK